MGHLVDIQTALKPLKNLEKKSFKIILGLDESFITMNRPDLTISDGLFLENYKI